MTMYNSQPYDRTTPRPDTAAANQCRTGRRAYRTPCDWFGFASLDLLRQSGETLAGRISHLELTPFTVLEVKDVASTDLLWVRGGFPGSYLARTDEASARWREDFVRTYLERDIPQLGPRVPVETLRRCWTMLAHNHGGLLNVSQLARNVGIQGPALTSCPESSARACRRCLPHDHAIVGAGHRTHSGGASTTRQP
jgi:hypothetical protein